MNLEQIEQLDRTMLTPADCSTESAPAPQEMEGQHGRISR